MTAPANGPDETPVELGYTDPLRRDLDIDTVIHRARGTRAMRWALATVAGVAALTVIGSVAVDRVDDPSRTAETDQAAMARVMAQPFAREHPPAGRAVLVDTSMPGWIVVAWISRAGEFCGGAPATIGGRTAPSALNCWLNTRGPAGVIPKVLSKPILQALPLPPDAGDSALAIGAITGAATRVEVVFRGSAVVAPVVVLPTGRAATVDAYAVWLPTSGTDTYSWNDITEVTARDSTGRIVAHLP